MKALFIMVFAAMLALPALAGYDSPDTSDDYVWLAPGCNSTTSSASIGAKPGVLRPPASGVTLYPNYASFDDNTQGLTLGLADAGVLRGLPAPSSTSQLSFGAWLMATNTMTVANYPRFISCQAFELALYGGPNTVYAYLNGGAATVGPMPPVSTNVWHHYAFIYNGKTLVTYYDGVPTASGAYTNSLVNFGTFRLGSYQYSASYWTFRGKASDVRVSFRAWSVAELREKMQRGKPQ